MSRHRRAILFITALIVGFAILSRLVAAETLGSILIYLPLITAPTTNDSRTATQVPTGITASSPTTTLQETVQSLPTATPTATATTVLQATATPTPTATATATPQATATPTPTATATPTPGTTTASQVSVGPGFTDTSPKQVIRTSGNRLYIAASDCSSYPCTSAAQTLRMYRAATSGVPTSFTRADSAREPAGVAGWSIAVDSNNLIHVAWTDRTASGPQINHVRYATFDTTANTWGASEILDTFDFNLGGQGMEGVSLALDTNGNPHVVYLKGTGSNTDRRVYYRNRIGGTWSSALQIDTTISYVNNQRAWHPNLAFDSAGRLLVLWERGSFNNDIDGTIYSRVRATNGSWGSAVAVSSQNGALTSIDTSIAIVITPDGTYHTTYIHASTTNSQKYIRYRYSTDQGATWNANDPAGGTQSTHNPALGYANGKVRIYGHGTPDVNNHGANIYYFESNGGASAWGSWTKVITGTNYDSSVNVRWSQYFYHFPNTIDIAFWDDNYPNQLYLWTK